MYGYEFTNGIYIVMMEKGNCLLKEKIFTVIWKHRNV